MIIIRLVRVRKGIRAGQLKMLAKVERILLILRLTFINNKGFASLPSLWCSFNNFRQFIFKIIIFWARLMLILVHLTRLSNQQIIFPLNN